MNAQDLQQRLNERLSDQDHQLLHELPGVHGDLVAWLERFLVNHGACAWSVLQVSLAEEGQLEAARRACGGRLDAMEEEELQFEDLQQLLRKLWLDRLKGEASQLASAPVGPDTLVRLKELHEQIRLLSAA